MYLLKSDLTRAMEVVDSADAAGLLSEFDAEMFSLRIISRDEGRLAEAVSRVFTRNFKQRYTMTPTEFRKKEN